MIDRVLAPESPFSKRCFFLARRFVAGASIDEAIAAVARLNDAGMTATLDFLGEDVLDAAAATQTRDTYFAMLDAIAQHGLRSNVSVKLTAMGLLIDEDVAYENLCAILKHACAVAQDPFVRIDMEGSSVTEATLRVFARAFQTNTNVGPVLQAYLHRTPQDIENMIALGARVRLCKGAYREPPEIALQNMSDIRIHYLACAMRLLERGIYPGIATHDRRLIAAVRAIAGERGIGPERFEFQMLYGVRPAVQRELVASGYNLRIYVPFGTHWAGYFYRRVTERRENALFAFSSIFSR